MASVSAPAEIYAVFDGSYHSLGNTEIRLNGAYSAWLPGAGKFNGAPWAGPNTANYIADYMGGRHNDGVNVAFADGHVKWLKSQVVWDASLRTTQNPFWPGTW